MSKTAFTIKVFGVYIFALGLALLIAPNILLSIFGIPETKEVWIRVLGVVVVNLGIYYWYAAKSEAKYVHMPPVKSINPKRIRIGFVKPISTRAVNATNTNIRVNIDAIKNGLASLFAAYQ